MRAAPATQTAFTAGEVDPRLEGRVDVARYYAGAALLRNVLVRPAGGVIRRPGMRHCATLAGGTDGVRLLPFAFNTQQTYAFAFASGTFTVFLPDGTQAAHVTGCPWTATQAAQLMFAQSADTLLLFHPDMAPQRIRRDGSDTAWLRDAVPLTNIPTFDYGAGAEPVISATRGWPATGTFHEGRLWMGGLRSRPATLLGSRTGLFFDFNVGTGADDDAINVTILSDQVNAIHALWSGRQLLVLTSGSERAVNVAPPITPTNIAIEEQSRRGIKRFTNPAEVDGATLFIQGGGAALRQLLYQDAELAWRADLLSLLAAHLIKDPVQLAARKGAAADDADYVLLVNSDGTVTVMTTLRSQEIVAFTRWDTDGQIRSACALASGEVFFAVQRAGSVRVERWDEAALLDASRRRVTPGGSNTVTGLAHLEGRSVTMIGDGVFMGEATVASGQVTLPRAAVTAEAGLRNTLDIRTLPYEPRAATGPIIGKKARLTNITARVHQTGPFEIGGRPVLHRRFGIGAASPLDAPPPVVTADIELRGLVGWRDRADVQVTQPEPAPFHLLALSYDAVIET